MATSGGAGIDWIGIDWDGAGWGDDRARAFAISADGAPIGAARVEDAAAPAPGEAAFEPRLLRLIGDWLPARGSIPVIACGAPGNGRDAAPSPARRVPCAPLDPDLLRRTFTDEARMALYQITGLRQDRPADAAQGAETRIAGYLAGTPGFDGVLCVIGRRTVWARISAGEVVNFAGFLTGALFTLLDGPSGPRRGADPRDAPDDPEAFGAALDEILSRPERLSAALSRPDLAEEGAGAARGRLAGALIGAELAAARPWWLGQAVTVIGGAEATRLYQGALARQGVAASTVDGQAMTLAGLALARAALRAQTRI